MKKALTLLIALALVFSLCACGQKAASDETVVVAVESTPAPFGVESTPVPVTLYQGDDNAEKLVQVPCELDELTAQAVLDKLLELGVLSEAVTVNSFSVNEQNIAVLDLGRSFQEQVSRMGTAGEYIMVGSLVNSIISAFGADGVALTIDGSSLETGHEIYDYTLGFFEG